MVKQRYHNSHHDEMLPNDLFKGDGPKRDINYPSYPVNKLPPKKYRDNSFIQQQNILRNANHIYEDNAFVTEMFTKRHRVPGNNNNLTMVSNNGNHPLVNSPNVISGTQNIYQPGMFDPRHVPNIFSRRPVGIGKHANQQHHKHVGDEIRERDATLLHHLGRMSPEEQLNKFLRSVEKEQELRQMKAPSNEHTDDKSPRERRRRRQLLKRMTDGWQSKPQNNTIQVNENRKTVNDGGNEYAVIDKKKGITRQKESFNNGNEPVRWLSLNGINSTSATEENSERINANEVKLHKRYNTRQRKDNIDTNKEHNKHTNKYEDELEKRKSIAYRNQYRERTDAPKSFASMSQLDNLLKGRTYSSESEENEGYEKRSFYLNDGKDLTDILSTSPNANHHYQKININETAVSASSPISHPSTMAQNSQTHDNVLSMTSSINSALSSNEDTLTANRKHKSKDGRFLWNERKTLSLSMLKAKFNHGGKTGGDLLLPSNNSSNSHSPNSLSNQQTFINQRHKSISPTEKMSIGSDDMMIKSRSSTNNSIKTQTRYNGSITKENNNMLIEDTDIEDDDEYNRMDGTDFSCSCTDVTLDDKYKITHKHVSASNYTEKDITPEIRSNMTMRNSDTLENINRNENRKILEIKEVDGSRSLDNITTGATKSSSNGLEEQQLFFSLNDSTTATQVQLCILYRL